MNKFISVILIIAMLMAFSLSVFAEDTTNDNNENVEEENDVIIPNDKLDGEESAEEDISATKNALAEAIVKGNTPIISDYTDESAAALTLAIEAAELVYNSENAVYTEISDAIKAIEEALTNLKAKKADVSEIKLLHTHYKYSDTKNKYNHIELDKAMAAAEAALKNSNLLISEAKSVEKMLQNVTLLKEISTAEEFLSMEANGNYVLTSNITLSEPYREFKGYISGGGHSISITNGAIFDILNGATVFDLCIEGNTFSEQSVGALANIALGEINIIDVVNNATISTNEISAGFIAQGEGADLLFKNCVNNASVIGDISAGFYGKTISGNNNIHFYNCLNNANIDGNVTAAGFVADTTEGVTKYILFEYCAELGNISASNLASAFFGCGKSNIELSGCLVGNGNISVSATENQKMMGGVIGYIDGNYGVDIIACSFEFDVKANDNAALIIGGSDELRVSINYVIAQGSVITVGDGAYRLTNITSDNLTLGDLFVNVSLMTYSDGMIANNPNAVDKFPNTDSSELDEKSFEEAAYGFIAFFKASEGMNVELKIESADMFKESFKYIMTVAEAQIAAEKEALREIINGTLKSPENYTSDSYSAYMSDIEQLFKEIEAITDTKSLEAIKLNERISAAELKLITLLDAAKADALVLLSAKMENTGKVFTKKSYEEYCAAYDLIVEKINNAQSIEELKAINLPALKVAAETKLVVDVPIIDEEDYNDVKNNDADVDERADKENNDQGHNTAKAEAGCLSSSGIPSIIIIGIIGGALTCKKKSSNIIKK